MLLMVIVDKKEESMSTASRVIIRAKRVVAETGLPRTTILRLEKQGQFPARVQLGPKAVGWFEDEVEAWKAERAEARNP
ncbi:MAG: helix-turn-helix transcriptional regulator [Pseudomonadota bacterium]